MNVTAVYLINGKLSGLSTFQVPFLPPLSLAYFCPTCGEIWARIIIKENANAWSLVTAPCADHKPSDVPSWSRVPGALLFEESRKEGLSTMFWGRALEHLPPTLFSREFSMHLQAYNNHLQTTEGNQND